MPAGWCSRVCSFSGRCRRVVVDAYGGVALYLGDLPPARTGRELEAVLRRQLRPGSRDQGGVDEHLDSRAVLRDSTRVDLVGCPLSTQLDGGERCRCDRGDGRPWGDVPADVTLP